MNRIILFLVFFSTSLSLSFNATAKTPHWKFIGENANSNVFVDTNNVSRQGSSIKYWGLLNFKNERNIDGISIKSSTMLKVTNCSKSTNQNLFSRMYSGPMGAGFAKFPYKFDENPEPITTGTFEDIAKELLCNKH